MSPRESIKDFQPIKFSYGLFENLWVIAHAPLILYCHVQKMVDSLVINFIANYWKQVVLATILGAIVPTVLYLIQYFSSERQKTQDKHSQLPEEHPLAEFRDAKPAEGEDLLNAPMHSEDTEHIPYVHISRTEEEMIQRSRDFYQLMNCRRSIRMFSSQSVPIEVIKNIVHTAGTSPSGMYHYFILYFSRDRYANAPINVKPHPTQYGDRWGITKRFDAKFRPEGGAFDLK